MNHLSWRVFTLDLYTNKVQRNHKTRPAVTIRSKNGPIFHKHANKNRQEKKVVCTFYTILVGWKVFDFHVSVMSLWRQGQYDRPSALLKPLSLFLKSCIQKEAIHSKGMYNFRTFYILATTMYVKVKSF